MKRRNYIKTALFSLLAMSTLTACLKDNSTTVDFSKATGSLELPAVAFTGTLQEVSFEVKSTPQVLPLMVNLSGAKPSGSDTKVTLSLDQNALTAYNTANSTSYELLPTSGYSVPNFSVTIPAGQRASNLNININSAAIDTTKSYALPLSITDGGGQPINPSYKTVIYAIEIK